MVARLRGRSVESTRPLPWLLSLRWPIRYTRDYTYGFHCFMCVFVCVCVCVSSKLMPSPKVSPAPSSSSPSTSTPRGRRECGSPQWQDSESGEEGGKGEGKRRRLNSSSCCSDGQMLLPISTTSQPALTRSVLLLSWQEWRWQSESQLVDHMLCSHTFLCPTHQI